MQIRKLTVSDVFCIALMFGKVTKSAREQLASALAKKKANPTEVGMLIFQNLLIEAGDDIKSWFADLIGTDKETFEKMPATTVLDIIEGLMDQEDIRDFFTKASALVSKVTR